MNNVDNALNAYTLEKIDILERALRKTRFIAVAAVVVAVVVFAKQSNLRYDVDKLSRKESGEA